MDASIVYTLVLKLASSGGTVYALAACGVSALLTAILGIKIYRETKKDNEIKQAKADIEQATLNGDANALHDACIRLRNLQKQG